MFLHPFAFNISVSLCLKCRDFCSCHIVGSLSVSGLKISGFLLGVKLFIFNVITYMVEFHLLSQYLFPLCYYFLILCYSFLAFIYANQIFLVFFFISCIGFLAIPIYIVLVISLGITMCIFNLPAY